MRTSSWTLGSRAEGGKKATSISLELIEGCVQARGTREEEQLYGSRKWKMKSGKCDTKCLSTAPSHAVSRHCRLMELRRRHDSDKQPWRHWVSTDTGHRLESADMHMLALPKVTLGFHTFADFAAGETGEKHEYRLYVVSESVYNDPLMKNWTPPPMTEEGKKLVTGDKPERLGFFLYPDVFTVEEQEELVRNCKEIIQARGDNNEGKISVALKKRLDEENRILDSINVMQRLIEKGIMESTINFMYLLLYEPNTYINAHRDSVSQFGPTITGVSLLGETVLTLRHCLMTDGEIIAAKLRTGYQPSQDTRHKKVSAKLPPGSVYVMSGRSRYDMTHETEAIDSERISITMREYYSRD